MFRIITVVLLAAAVVGAAALSGALGGVAPQEWLVLLGLALLAGLLAVALYRAALGDWARAKHPATLRLLATVVGLDIWILGFAAQQRASLGESLSWGLTEVLGPLSLWMFALVLLIQWLVVYSDARARSSTA